MKYVPFQKKKTTIIHICIMQNVCDFYKVLKYAIELGSGLNHCLKKYIYTNNRETLSFLILAYLCGGGPCWSKYVEVRGNFVEPVSCFHLWEGSRSHLRSAGLHSRRFAF